MKVERAWARSSAAPMRVWMASTGPEPAGVRGHERAHGGEQHDERHLAHEGALAAHVRAGDDEHLPVRVEAAVIGDEAAAAELGQSGFDNRVTAAGDLDAGLARELRPPPFEGIGALGQRRERIEARERSGEGGQRLEVRLQEVEEPFEQQLLARQRSLLRRERLVLEGLQLRGDEAFRVLERLPPR
jgi:hypothetical protein